MLIAPGIHHFDTDPFNWYVIEEGGRLTLVDAGFPGHYRVFAEGIRSLGRSISDVEAVIVTHAHADHMGFASRVATEANAPIFMHKDDILHAERVLQLPWFGLLSNAWRPFMAGMLSRAIMNGVFSSARIPAAKPFGDGAELDVPGKPRVIHVPGHTPGEVALYFQSKRVLLSGDSIVTRDLYTGSLGKPQVPRPALNADDKVARASLDRLLDLGQIMILPGHGRPWQGDIREAVQLARGVGKFQ